MVIPALFLLPEIIYNRGRLSVNIGSKLLFFIQPSGFCTLLLELVKLRQAVLEGLQRSLFCIAHIGNTDIIGGSFQDIPVSQRGGPLLVLSFENSPARTRFSSASAIASFSSSVLPIISLVISSIVLMDKPISVHAIEKLNRFSVPGCTPFFIENPSFRISHVGIIICIKHNHFAQGWRLKISICEHDFVIVFYHVYAIFIPGNTVIALVQVCNHFIESGSIRLINNEIFISPICGICGISFIDVVPALLLNLIIQKLNEVPVIVQDQGAAPNGFA